MSEDREQQVLWLGLTLIAAQFFFGGQFKTLWSVFTTRPSGGNPLGNLIPPVIPNPGIPGLPPVIPLSQQTNNGINNVPKGTI